MRSFLLFFFLLASPFALKVHAQSISIYSGPCVKYEKTFVGGSKVKLTAVKKAFAKVVLNRSAKKVNIYFDGQLIYSGKNYLSHIDDQQGGEGFSFDNGYSAHRFTAERLFIIYYNLTGENYQYEIQPYSTN